MDSSEEIESVGIICGDNVAKAIESATGLCMEGIESLDDLSSVNIDDAVQRVVFFHDVSEEGNGVDPRIYEFIDKNIAEDVECYALFLPHDEDSWEFILQSDPSVLESAMQKAILIEEPDDDDLWAQMKAPLDEDYLDITDEAKAVQWLNEVNAIVTIKGKTNVLTETCDPQTNKLDIIFSSKDNFKFRYANWLINEKYAVDLWFQSKLRRQYDAVTFCPLGNCPDRYYNLFRGFPVKPVMGDCNLYWDHVFDNICNGNSKFFNYVKKWMAHAIQHPETLPETALVLMGEQGTGKGVFVNFFGMLFGQHYMTIYRLDQITGRFNSHLKNILLLHANEAICQGDKVSEGVLKGIVTDPTIPIEYKGKDVINVPNYKRLIIATNEEWAVPVGMDDRRFFIMGVSNDHKEDQEYFNAISEQMNTGGLAALMYDLKNENLDGFEIRTLPYSNVAFEQKLYNSSSLVSWWYEMLKEGCTVDDDSTRSDGWKTDPIKEVLYSNFKEWCKAGRVNALSAAIFGKKLCSLLPGYDLSGSKRMASNLDGKRHNCYAFPELDKCRKAFEVFSKSGIEIWKD